jgi:hypothetical protein
MCRQYDGCATCCCLAHKLLDVEEAGRRGQQLRVATPGAANPLQAHTTHNNISITQPHMHPSKLGTVLLQHTNEIRTDECIMQSGSSKNDR